MMIWNKWNVGWQFPYKYKIFKYLYSQSVVLGTEIIVFTIEMWKLWKSFKCVMKGKTYVPTSLMDLNLGFTKILRKSQEIINK